jgi:hypothetical protein
MKRPRKCDEAVEACQDVELRQAGEQWSVEVLGASIGMAETQSEAKELAAYWQARMNFVARRRGQSQKTRLRTWLSRLLNVQR